MRHHDTISVHEHFRADGLSKAAHSTRDKSYTHMILPSYKTPYCSTVSATPSRAARAVIEWIRRRKAIRDLQALDDRMLADIGLI